MTITEFLEARIAEDEGDHYPYHSADFGYAPGDVTYGCVECGMDAGQCRVQRESSAKRAIIASRGIVDDLHDEYAVGLRDESLSHLASVYSDHPDYLQEWAL